MALLEFQEKKTARKIIFSLPVLVGLIAITLWMIYGAISAAITLRELSQKNNELQKKIEDVQKSKEAIEKKMNLMETDYGIDLEARANFNLKKPGEEIILFIEEE